MLDRGATVMVKAGHLYEAQYEFTAECEWEHAWPVEVSGSSKTCRPPDPGLLRPTIGRIGGKPVVGRGPLAWTGEFLTAIPWA
ncbi:hypothetical protein [Streptomyces sp. NPDC088178]|uniref:hypothetical protein n=1 Tax=Streptomyces sp. NPDC088178 TaxID=3365836 RepID=UPI003804BCA7